MSENLAILEKMPQSKKEVKLFAENLINSIQWGEINPLDLDGQLKALEEKIETLRTRLSKLQDKGESATRINMGDMGLDMLFIDESQEFKNLMFYTGLRNVAGLGNPKGSKRASNLKMICRYLQSIHGGDKGVVFASGTPISNSLTELYNIFQYLRPSLLKSLGMNSLDQFIKSFAVINSAMEKNVAGVIRNKTRLNKFVNVTELANSYTEISDIRSTHNLKLPRPEIRGGKPEVVLIPQSETQKRITKAIYDASKKGCILSQSLLTKSGLTNCICFMQACIFEV